MPEYPITHESEEFPTSNSHIYYKIFVDEISVDEDANTSVVTVRVNAYRNDDQTTTGGGTGLANIQGTTYKNTITSQQRITSRGVELFRKSNLTIPHETGGQLTVTVRARLQHSYFTSEYHVFAPALTTIPRYATITQTLSARAEETITMQYSTDRVIDRLWYSVDGGTSFTSVSISEGQGGTYTITGLTANTAYSIVTRVRRKDSQLTSNSTALAVQTYPFPYANNTPNYTIGDNMLVGIYNPLGRTVQVFLSINDSYYGTYSTTTGDSATIYVQANAPFKAWIYAQTPNSPTVTYQVRCVTLGTATVTTGGTLTINPVDCTPIITGGEYEDTNAAAIAITHDDQLIIRNISTVSFTALGLAGTMSATVASCSVTINGVTTQMTVSGTSASCAGVIIDSAYDTDATFTVTDSRGVTFDYAINVSMLDWVAPTALITLERQNNFYTLTYITVDAQYSYLNGENTISITYKARQAGTSPWTVSGTLTDNVQSSFNADNTYAWDVQVTLTDVFATTVYNLHLSRGLPIIYFDRIKSSVGINCFPVDDDSFEVSGKRIWEFVYPVGAVYISTDSTSPATLFGGTWDAVSGFPASVNAWERKT